jgi:hypothetical protein
MTTHHDADADGDREIMDTIRMYLYACYVNVEDERAFAPEELEQVFASDAGLRAWISNTAGIDPDTLVASTPIGRAFVSACMNSWVARVRGDLHARF